MEKKKKSRFRWLLIPLSVCLILYLAYQVYASVYRPYQTETATRVSVQDTIRVEGLPIRDEVPIQNEAGGAICYLYDNGTKISKDSEVAAVYADQQAAADRIMAQRLQKELDMLIAGQNTETLQSVQPDDILRRIHTLQLSLSEMAANGSAAQSDELRLSMLQSIQTRKQIFGTAGNPSDRIALLQSRIAELTAASPLQSIRTPASGYFVNSTDGFETLLSTDMIDSLTAEDLRGLIDRSDVSGDPAAIGKVIVSYDWYYAGILPMDVIRRVAVGSTVGVQFPALGAQQIPFTVTSADYNADLEEGFVILTSDYMSEEISGIRDRSATVCLAEHEGLSVSKEAVRVQNGVKGVYVYTNSKVQFKQVDVVYESEDVVISRIHSAETEPGFLQEYDDVIVKGKNLDEAEQADSGQSG